MSLSKKIEDLLVDEKLEALLTTSALKKMSELAESVNDLECLLEDKNGTIKRVSKEAEQYLEKLNVANGKILNLQSKTTDIETREKAITVLECNAKHESQRVEDHKNMFSLVFRNTEVKKNMFESANVPVLDNNGYISQQNSNSDKTETTIRD